MTLCTLSGKQVRAAIYTRISDDRHGEALGVARQERDDRELADRRGWVVDRVFTDNDSGDRRPPAARVRGHAGGDPGR